MNPDPESAQDETNLDYETIGIAAVVAVSGAASLWKITSTANDAYYTERSAVAKLAAGAKESRRKVKVGSLLDATGRRMLHSAALSVEGRVSSSEQESAESPRDDYLF